MLKHVDCSHGIAESKKNYHELSLSFVIFNKHYDGTNE